MRQQDKMSLQCGYRYQIQNFVSIIITIHLIINTFFIVNIISGVLLVTVCLYRW